MSTFDLASELGVLSIGRDPSGQAHAVSDTITNPPAAATDGADLEDGVVALVAIDVRENVAYRTARLAIDTLNIGDTFTATVDGNDVAYDSTGDADLDEVVQEIAAAINADGTVGLLVTATAVRASDDDTTVGVRDSVRLTGRGFADYSLGWARTGSSVISATADASGCEAEVLAQRTAAPGTTANTRWRKTSGTYVIEQRGYMDRWNIAGISRAFVQLSAIQGPGADAGVTLRTPDIDIAPAILEA